MNPRKLKQPKVFILYSWSSLDHEDWVLILAKKLRRDGIDVILDKWDIGVGHDKYVFMEQMVTDKDVSKVIIISDRLYKEKADKRIGGVGTESQIISQEIYESVNQDKFIPVVTEYDDRFEPCLPLFLRNRMFIDLSPSANFEENYSLLLRCLFDLPLHFKPALGTPPKHIVDLYQINSEALQETTYSDVNEKKPLVLNNIELPHFEIISEKVDDMPIKTQIHQDILVTGKVSKESLSSFLLKQYKTVKERKGFKYHDSPTNVYIYIYDQKKKAKAGQGLWLAMLQMSPMDPDFPKITIKENQIQRIGRKPEEKFGLPEVIREKVFKEIVVAEDNAMNEAIKVYPYDIQKQSDLEDKLRQKYLDDLAENYGLDKGQISKIAVEGLENQWIMPSTVENVIFPKKRVWDSDRMVVTFPAEIDGRKIPCSISLEALEDHFSADYSNALVSFDANRSKIESIAENVIRLEQFESNGSILIRTMDISQQHK